MLNNKNREVLNRMRRSIDANMSEEEMKAEMKQIATVLANDRLETWISEFSFEQQKNGPKVVHEFREDSHEHNDERNDEVVEADAITEVTNIDPEMLMLTQEQMSEDERLRMLFSMEEVPIEDEPVEVKEEAIPERIIESKRRQFFDQEYKELLETAERMQRMDDFNNEVDDEKEILVGITCCYINKEYKPFIRLEKDLALELCEAGILTGTNWSVAYGYTQLSTTDYDGDVDINWEPLYLEDFSSGDILRPCLPNIPEVITMQDFINNRTRGMGQAEIIKLVEEGEIRYGGDTSRTGNHDPNVMTANIKHGRYDESPMYDIQKLEDDDHPSMKGYSYRNWEEQRYHYETISEKLDRAESFAELQKAMNGYLFSDGRWEISNNALTTDQRDRLKTKWKRRRSEMADVVIDKLSMSVARDDLREVMSMLIPDKWAAISVAARGSELKKETGVNYIEPRCWKIIQLIAKEQFVSDDKLINGERLIDQLRKKEKQVEQCSQDEALAILSYAKEMLMQKKWKLLKPETYEKLTSIVKGRKEMPSLPDEMFEYDHEQEKKDWQEHLKEQKEE